MRRFRELDWLWVFLLSWVAPVIYDAKIGLEYWSSLLFWLVPIFVLAPRYLSHTDQRGRRRRAFGLAVGSITVLGLILDFVFGHRILRFDDPVVRYLGHIPSLLGPPIPVEEVAFYALGPIAILLVYVWCDEFWLSAYNIGAGRTAVAAASPIAFSPMALVYGLALIGGGIWLRMQLDPTAGLIPQYFTFLVLVAIVPAMALFKSVVALVNWRAFVVTTLYLLMTSLIWEAILALPRHWWGYRPEGMTGVWVRTFASGDGWPLPIEAVLVWVVTPFSLVLTYEAIKRSLYLRRPAKIVYEPAGA